MKNFKTLLLLLLTFSIGVTSCKKDDEKPDAELTLTGKWFLKKEIYNGYKNGQLAVGPETYTGYTSVDYMDFKADGKGTLSEEGDTDNFTYTINNEKTLVTIKYEGDNDSQSWTVKSFTSTDLVVVNEDIYSLDGDNYRAVTEITLKK